MKRTKAQYKAFSESIQRRSRLEVLAVKYGVVSQPEWSTRELAIKVGKAIEMCRRRSEAAEKGWETRSAYHKS